MNWLHIPYLDDNDLLSLGMAGSIGTLPLHIQAWFTIAPSRCSAIDMPC